MSKIKVEINYPLDYFPQYQHYYNLREWVVKIGLSCDSAFYWTDSGKYLPSHMVLDSESAMFYTLAVQNKTL
jgi:hypothetical protein